jgi:hypothetical protein
MLVATAPCQADGLEDQASARGLYLTRAENESASRREKAGWRDVVAREAAPYFIGALGPPNLYLMPPVTSN